MPLSSMASEDSTVMVSGTSIRDSSRFRAETVISSSTGPLACAPATGLTKPAARTTVAVTRAAEADV